MQRNLFVVTGIVVIFSVVGLAAFNMTGSSEKKAQSVVNSTEQLRLGQIEAKRAQREALGSIPDFSPQTQTGPLDPQAQPTVRFEGQRTVVPGILPPKLAGMKAELDQLNQKMRRETATAERLTQDEARAAAIITKADLLIADADARYGLDSSGVAQQLRIRREQAPPSAEASRLGREIDALDAELGTWARERAAR